MKIAASLLWLVFCVAALFLQPILTAVTTIAIVSMLWLVVLSLEDIRLTVGKFLGDVPESKVANEEAEPVKCPRCDEVNSASRTQCWNCGLSLKGVV